MKQVNVTRRNVNVMSVVGVVVILLLCSRIIRLINGLIQAIGLGFSGLRTVLDQWSGSRFGQMCTRSAA